MSRGRFESERWRWLGVVILTLGLAHVPLPTPDYHSARHHDAPGEVCEHHDHLLRWHPQAGPTEDVPLLHWHWVLPSGGTSPVTTAPGSGAGLHAHVPDWPMGTWDEAPVLTAGRPARLHVRAGSPERGHFLVDLSCPSTPTRAGCIRRLDPFPRAPSARASLAILLQRWVC